MLFVLLISRCGLSSACTFTAGLLGKSHHGIMDPPSFITKESTALQSNPFKLQPLPTTTATHHHYQ